MINPVHYNDEAPLVAVDTETELFGYANMAPRVVCYSFAWRDAAGEVHTALADKDAGAKEFADLLEQARDRKVTLALHNGPYDYLVHLRKRPQDWPLVVDAHEAGGCHDTMISEWLLDTAEGLLRQQWDEEKQEWKMNKSYALEALAINYLRWMPYKDEWRMRYAELMDTPISAWPEAAVIYPKKDADATLRIAEMQRSRAREIGPHDPLLADQARQCRAYLALSLVSAWGMELDPQSSRTFQDRLQRACEQLATEETPDGETLVASGILYRHVRGKKNGQLSVKDAPLRSRVEEYFAARGIVPKMTDGGESGENKKVKANAEVLSDCGDDPLLVLMSDYLECNKQRTSFADKAVELGRGPCHGRYGWADSGRSTMSGGKKRKGSMLAFNLQQMPRNVPDIFKVLGYNEGMRENFVPRAGHVFSSTDFSILEMHTWAQVREIILPGDENPLKYALNAGRDPHVMLAARVPELACSYEEAFARYEAKDKSVKKWRQDMKPANYGYPGGMGPDKMVIYAKGQNVHMVRDTAVMLRELFYDTWLPRPYFRLISEMTQGGNGRIVQVRSGRIRGGVGYTDACNGFFQGLAADLAKDALWRIVIECYDERKRSPLLGSRIVGFFHDEYFGEHPEDAAHEAATRVGELARETARDWCPDMTNMDAAPALMRRWSKAGGDAVHNKHGRLIPWEDRNAA